VAEPLRRTCGARECLAGSIKCLTFQLFAVEEHECDSGVVEQIAKRARRLAPNALNDRIDASIEFAVPDVNFLKLGNMVIVDVLDNAGGDRFLISDEYCQATQLEEIDRRFDGDWRIGCGQRGNAVSGDSGSRTSRQECSGNMPPHWLRLTSASRWLPACRVPSAMAQHSQTNPQPEMCA
jgi:hypothetical protein